MKILISTVVAFYVGLALWLAFANFIGSLLP